MRWELAFMEWGKGWWSLPFLDHVIPWLTHIGSHVAVILFLLSGWLLTRRRRVFYALFFSYAIQTLVIYGLKFAIQRPRPPILPGFPSTLSRGPGEILDPSFPSAHTAYAFMMATLLTAWVPRYRLFFFGVAGFVGWTRIYLGLHYPTDVLAGALLGYGLTALFLRCFCPPVCQNFSGNKVRM